MLVAPLLQAAEIRDVRLWRAPDSTRIVFDLDQPVSHKLLTLSNPDRLVIDLKSSKMSADTAALALANTPIRGIRHAIQKNRDLRIVLDLRAAVKEKSFLLKRNESYGDRLVIDLFDKAKRPAKVVKRAQQPKNPRRDIVIAIDAGHGGEDPGALGPKKQREKIVVLAIARELNKLVAGARGYRPVMIRDGDYYVSLKKRRDIARQNQADLFVSIHADAFTSPKAAGSSVYVLSSRGASSASAQFLAATENSTDKIGGVELASTDEYLSEVLVDLSMTHKMETSESVGSAVLQSIDGITHLHSKHVERAAFAVLKAPDIPSILVETGFISNPGEARKLTSSSYQKKMAKAIFSGITRYYGKHAPEDTYIGWQNRHQPREYVIARGDTLSEIAQRYRVSVADIRKHNSLKGNQIRVGQRILIPAS